MNYFLCVFVKTTTKKECLKLGLSSNGSHLHFSFKGLKRAFFFLHSDDRIHFLCKLIGQNTHLNEGDTSHVRIDHLISYTHGNVLTGDSKDRTH